MSFWNSKPKRLIEKIKPERKKGKNNEVWVKHQCRNDGWWRDTCDVWKVCLRWNLFPGTPSLSWNYWELLVNPEQGHPTM